MYIIAVDGKWKDGGNYIRSYISIENAGTKYQAVELCALPTGAVGFCDMDLLNEWYTVNEDEIIKIVESKYERGISVKAFNLVYDFRFVNTIIDL